MPSVIGLKDTLASAILVQRETEARKKGISLEFFRQLHQRKTQPGLEVQSNNPCYWRGLQVQDQVELYIKFKTCAIQQDSVLKGKGKYQWV